MNLLFIIFTSLLAGGLSVTAILRRRRSVATWCACLGLAVLGLETALFGIVQALEDSAARVVWTTAWILVQSLFPVFWLTFSLTYSRGEPRQFLRQWRFILICLGLLPLPVVAGLGAGDYGFAEGDSGWWLAYGSFGKFFTGVALFSSVFILVNLENTFRASVGLERWRIKFLLLGVACIFGAKIYTLSQALLYSGTNAAMLSIESGGLFVGCLLLIVAYRREGFSALGLYPSREVLQGSITVFLAGTYLVVVGLLSHVVTRTGNHNALPSGALVILVGLAGLATILLSDRSDQKLRSFVSRHFRRPQHDARLIWTRFTKRTSGILDKAELCREFAKLLSESFDVLSVTLLLREEDGRKYTVSATTRESESAANSVHLPELSSKEFHPFELDSKKGRWAEILREHYPNQFAKGGQRWVVPFAAGEQVVGLAVLGDRVNGTGYRQEELDLLQCIGEHIGTALLNRNLSEKLAEGAQLQAFQTMSTFFAHDLKNAANHLSLMLGNLPKHFDNPEFREDALRSISRNVDHINNLVGRLNEFRTALDLESAEFDLNGLVGGVIETFKEEGTVRIESELNPLPVIQGDPDRLQSVVSNLIINAREATVNGDTCTIGLQTEQENEYAVISVSDRGCGMAPEFIKDSLFRPFCTTKSKKGIGIGMFQAKMIVEAHHGKIEVESEVGEGTTFRVLLPVS